MALIRGLRGVAKIFRCREPESNAVTRPGGLP